ncbi:MAG: VOC family protein, partial [Pseudomonadota bacterium]|nr:VOC family protein [Pseudomonadota bacterium]
MDLLSTRDVPKVDFKPRRLGHVNLFVGDLNSSTDFHTNVAGIELVRREPGIDAVFVSNGNTHHDVALMQCKGGAVRTGRGGYVQASSFRGEVPGLNHLAWEMHSEAALVDKLKTGTANGLEIKFSADHLISHSAYIE